MIAENLDRIRAELKAACVGCGRDPEEVRLIAVSKFKPAEDILEAYTAGQRLFGENRAQELTAKREVLPKDIEWHFIGNLQKNKVKYLVGTTALIHSVNSEGLLREIERIAAAREVTQEILLELNVAGEASKQGAPLSEAEELVRLAAALPHVKLRGLMTVAPLSADPEDSRPVFRLLREKLELLRPLAREPEAFDLLSMGMSGDYLVAAEEGASFVRVGTAVFGVRNRPL